MMYINTEATLIMIMALAFGLGVILGALIVFIAAVKSDKLYLQARQEFLGQKNRVEKRLEEQRDKAN